MTRVANASCLMLMQRRRNMILQVKPDRLQRKGLAGKAYLERLCRRDLAGKAPRRKGPLNGKALARKAPSRKGLDLPGLPGLPTPASLQDIAHYVTCTTCRAMAAVRLEFDCWKRIEIIPLLNVDTKELKSAENEFNLFNVRLTAKAGFHSIHF